VTSDRKSSYSADLVQQAAFAAPVSSIRHDHRRRPDEVIESQQCARLFDALRNTAGVTNSQTSPTVYNNLSIRA